MITTRGMPSQLKAKIQNGIPDQGFQMTHKPSKFGSSFGTDGSQLVPKKSNYVSKNVRMSPDALQKEAKEEASKNIRLNS